MVFTSEVKNFIKNTLILTLFFTLVLHLSWGYVGPMFGVKTNAGANDLAFQQADINYLGSIATAMSLQLGQKESLIKNQSVNTASNTISITEVLENPEAGQQKLIGNNMIAISSYINILSTDIPTLLDNATSRERSLNEHISLLKSYYNKTLERITIINEQIADLTGIINQSNTDTNGAKTVMESSFVGYDYSGVDGAIDTYVGAKNKDTRARVYLIYLEKFKKSYTTLQTKNLKLIDTLVNNKDALIKRSTVVIPDSGSELIKTLKLIQTEKEVNAEKTLQ
ncbi:hypothetical protein HOO68_00115 [Candidatus Gracilibacteria bacterium]|nr:hypothetical protein [Candidatus Gracilibacteria bacterium]